MTEQRSGSATWRGWLEIEGPFHAVHHRTGERLQLHGWPYKQGTVWAYDSHGGRAGRQTFDIFEFAKIIVLNEAGLAASDGDNGKDNTGQGGGRAMLNLLEAAYPSPEWWLASSERADHTQDGIDFMRRREESGYRKVHTERCAIQHPRPNLPCGCDFQDRVDREAALQELGYELD